MAPSLKVLRAALTGQPTVEPTPTPAAAHGWLKLPERTEADVAVKPAVYLPIYESLLAPLRDRPLKILELGVWGGDSLIMWRDSLPQATIVGVDLVPPDLELGPRVHIIHGNQTDGELMSRLRAEHAPAGFDVIIDDASHLGITTARSLQVLYAQHLRAGGIYIIEDTGTTARPRPRTSPRSCSTRPPPTRRAARTSRSPCPATTSAWSALSSASWTTPRAPR
jgi:hypothetical protein